MAEGFIEAGAEVAIIGRSESVLNIGNEIGASGIQADLSSRAAVESGFKEVSFVRLGRIPPLAKTMLATAVK